jgi:hypothetical protein
VVEKISGAAAMAGSTYVTSVAGLAIKKSAGQSAFARVASKSVVCWPLP